MSRSFPWYDSIWLSQYVASKAYLEAHHPDRAADFVAALAPLRTRADFEVQVVRNLLGADVRAELKAIVKGLALEKLELHEVGGFGRFVVHDLPALHSMQVSMVDVVSDRVGEQVEVSYSFLSLYTNVGRCPVHMDAPSSKWTLDICVDQSEPWPIYFSEIVPWPEDFDFGGEAWSEHVRIADGHTFSPHTLEPGDALIFSGASQWHYRDCMPHANGTSFATMLFFHFIPAGMRELVQPQNWGRLFGVRELTHVVTDAHRSAMSQLDRGMS
jgi:hypothetical protein